MDNEERYYKFSKAYENREVTITLKNGKDLRGYIEVVFPADEDDTNRVSFALTTKHGLKNIYLDEIDSIQEIK